MGSSSESGGKHLAKKSIAAKLRDQLTSITKFLVIEDEATDADRLQATLRLMLGYEINIQHAPTLNIATDMILKEKPDLVFLDDVLKPSDTALQSIPLIRRAGYEGPIVVVSGQVTRTRRNELLDKGATDIIHKDNVDSVSISECLARVFGTDSKAT